MRTKTIAQLNALAKRAERWKEDYPWVSVGPHGMQCGICKAAGVKSSWARGTSALISMFGF